MRGRGMFITCEGPEGSGKSTHSRCMVEQLCACGISAVLTREPGGTPTGEAIRQLLQHNGAGEPPVATTETLLFCASRAQLMERVIEPTLASGAWVVCDRFTDSTLAYQGYGRGFDLTTLRALNAFATGGLIPDITLLFDIDTATSFSRLQERASAQTPTDRFECESRAFHETIRKGFLALAAAEPARFNIVDSTQPFESVRGRVWEIMRPHLEQRGCTHAG